MLLLLGYLLITVGFACGRPPFLVDDYLVTVHKGVLKSVQETSNSNGTLDLSGWGLVGIERMAFNGLKSLKSLNLDDNDLESLPELLFLQLENLESLSMAESTPRFMRHIFVGLSKLKSLNIDGDSGEGWNDDTFVGLNKSIIKITKSEGLSLVPQVSDFDPETMMILCSDNDIIKSVKYTANVEILRTAAKNCSHAHLVKPLNNNLYLENMGIKGFEKGWLYTHNLDIHSVFLKGNEIKHVTSALTNDLPDSVFGIRLQNNPIERLAKGIMKNKNLYYFDFSICSISEIEDGAFDDTGVRMLYLPHNKLKNPNFVSTLSSDLRSLDLSYNNIDKLPDVSHLKNLEILAIDHNDISNLNKDSFKGLPKTVEKLRY